MGAYMDFTCPACRLSGHVSGGLDAGMNSTTTTIYCSACEELQDAETGMHLDGPNAQTHAPRCQNQASHPIREWDQDQPCPRCGKGRMKMMDGRITLWD